MTDLLRRDLGFEGVTISDALDMAGVGEWPGRGARCGRRDPGRRRPAVGRRGSRGVGSHRADAGRGGGAGSCSIRPRWPPRNVVLPRSASGCGRPARRRTSRSLAARHIRRSPMKLATRVDHARPRSRVGLLPVRAQRVLAVMPRPTDLTPADTSSTVAPALAAALRRYHADVDEVVVEPEPDAAAIAAIRERARDVDLASSAPSTPIDSDRSSTWSRRSPRPTRPRSPSRCEDPGTSPAIRPG